MARRIIWAHEFKGNSDCAVRPCLKINLINLTQLKTYKFKAAQDLYRPQWKFSPEFLYWGKHIVLLLFVHYFTLRIQKLLYINKCTFEHPLVIMRKYVLQLLFIFSLFHLSRPMIYKWFLQLNVTVSLQSWGGGWRGVEPSPFLPKLGNWSTTKLQHRPWMCFDMFHPSAHHFARDEWVASVRAQI